MIINRQKRIAVAPRKLESFLARVTEMLHLPREAATVCFVTDAQMAKWNHVYRGMAKPTDVLSFPVAPDSPIQASQNKTAGRDGSLRTRRNGIHIHLRSAIRAGHGIYLGDIAIAPAVARRNAVRLGRPCDDEMRILILHGILHLMGYDHERDHGEMERLELRLRRRLGLA